MALAVIFPVRRNKPLGPVGRRFLKASHNHSHLQLVFSIEQLIHHVKLAE